MHPDHVILIYEDITVQGFISMHILPEIGLKEDTAIITYLVVNNEARSKGIGRELEKACVEIAKEKGCCRIQLHCSIKRTRAHVFYEALDYRESPKYYSKNIK